MNQNSGGEKSEDKYIWHVTQYVWQEHEDTPPTADKTTLLVEARTCAKAAELAQENDGLHEIERIVSLGPVVVREQD